MSMTRNYDLVVILDPELKDEEQEKLLAKIKKIISDSEGKISETKQWGKRVLAYRVSKRDSGFFVEFKFTAPANLLSSIRQKIKIEEQVLRYLLVVEEKGHLR